MTIPIDATLTATMGAAFYTAARSHIPVNLPASRQKATSNPPARSLLASPYYLWGMTYNVAVGMGIAVTAYLLNPDWMWMYWLDASRLSMGFTIYVFLMYPAMFTLGFLLADQTDRLGNRGSAIFLTGLAGLLLAFIILTFDRIWNVGTSSQWDAGTCTPMIGPGFSMTPLAQALLIGLVFAIISFVWLLKRFAKRGH